MKTSDIETVVRLVLPALNIEPSQFILDSGFLVRAMRGDRPKARALNCAAKQFVFLGARVFDDPEKVVTGMAEDALLALTSEARSMCEQLIVVWADKKDAVFAAAFSVLADGTVGNLLATSWTRPDTWPQPMIDASLSDNAAIAAALDHVESLLASRQDDAFDVEFDRAQRRMTIALLRAGATPQITRHPPGAAASDEQWITWLDHHRKSIASELHRVGLNRRPNAQTTNNTFADGPLTGLKVFLSYALPEATELAWPVYQALTTLGADVWFDQSREVEQDELDLGLAESIGNCDAYIVCASNEFMERAGYATQELVWAIEKLGVAAKLNRAIVVARPDTMLPTAIVTWPLIELYGSNPQELASRLLQHLSGPKVLSAHQAVVLSAAAKHDSPQIIAQTDLATLCERAAHVQLFEEIEQEVVDLLLEKVDRADARVARVARRLNKLGEGLNWTGTLRDIHEWPEDSFIRAVRFRFASTRVLASVRWPLSGKLDPDPDVDHDVEQLATQGVPLLRWATMSGWDEVERRWDLRNHAGLLRTLEELLRRGLDAGLCLLSYDIKDAWLEPLRTRHRECLDGLLTSRAKTEQSWQSNPPGWDSLFRAWSKVFKTRPWREPVPAEALMVLVANITEVAAVAAEVCWCRSRLGGYVAQSCNLRRPPASIEIYALGPGATDLGDVLGKKHGLRLGLVATSANTAEIRLALFAPYVAARHPPLHSSAPAPAQLFRVFHRSSN